MIKSGFAVYDTENEELLNGWIYDTEDDANISMWGMNKSIWPMKEINGYHEYVGEEPTRYIVVSINISSEL